MRILAKVMQGNNPVIQARVKAYVEIPSGPVEILELFDNGASADTTANDGIYSRYFTSASVQGRYTVECEIWGDGTAFVNDGFAARNIGTFRKGSSKNIGLFTRMADGGSFKVKYVDCFLSIEDDLCNPKTYLKSSDYPACDKYLKSISTVESRRPECSGCKPKG